MMPSPFRMCGYDVFEEFQGPNNFHIQRSPIKHEPEPQKQVHFLDATVRLHNGHKGTKLFEKPTHFCMLLTFTQHMIHWL